MTCDTVMNATCTNVFASTLGCHTEGSCYSSFEIIVKKLILVPVIVDYYTYLTLYVTYGVCVYVTCYTVNLPMLHVTQCTNGSANPLGCFLRDHVEFTCP